MVTPSQPSDGLLSEQIAGAIQVAQRTGLLATGILECMVSVRKGSSKLVIVAEDIEPDHITDDLTLLCARRRVPLLRRLSRKEIAAYASVDCPTAAVSIEIPGENLAYFQDALRQAHVNPMTFHEVALIAHTTLMDNSIGDLVGKMGSSLAAIHLLDHGELADIADNGTREELSKRLSLVLACSLAIAAHFEIDLLQYLSCFPESS